MRYIRAYSILEVTDDKDIEEMIESVERCIKENGEQYGITDASVEAVSKATREELKR